MTGSGNDFVMVDGRVSAPDGWTPADIQAACARGTGVGADGLVFLSPGAQRGAVRMIYFNSDGSRAAMCGNAALCSTTLAAHLTLGAPDGMDLETDAGTYRSRTAGPAGAGRAELGLAPLAPPVAVPGLRLAAGEQRAALSHVGVPHLVVLVDDVDDLDLAGRGRALRFDPAIGPEGANVNFISPADTKDAWRMRTYERGVEGETLACGTGSVAAACAIQEWGLGRVAINIVTRSGRLLEIKTTKGQTGRYEDVWLAGEGRMVFRGVLT
jgi:diaminopimelate epimerase